MISWMNLKTILLLRNSPNLKWKSKPQRIWIQPLTMVVGTRVVGQTISLTLTWGLQIIRYQAVVGLLQVWGKKLNFRKCFPLVLGGESMSNGKCHSSMNLWVCNELICMECSHKIVRINGKKWKSSAEYIFFTNYVRNPQKLLEVRPLNTGYWECKWLVMLCLSVQVDIDKRMSEPASRRH